MLSPTRENQSAANLIARASAGDVDAQARLGRAYQFGETGIGKNLNEAKKWFILASKNPQTPAGLYALARCCDNGWGWY